MIDHMRATLESLMSTASQLTDSMLQTRAVGWLVSINIDTVLLASLYCYFNLIWSLFSLVFSTLNLFLGRTATFHSSYAE